MSRTLVAFINRGYPPPREGDERDCYGMMAVVGGIYTNYISVVPESQWDEDIRAEWVEMRKRLEKFRAVGEWILPPGQGVRVPQYEQGEPRTFMIWSDEELARRP